MAAYGPPDGLPVKINAILSPSSVKATELLWSGTSEGRRQLYELEKNLSKEIQVDRRHGRELTPNTGQVRSSVFYVYWVIQSDFTGAKIFGNCEKLKGVI